MGDVTLADAKARLSELVSRAENGEETVITRRGQPVARLVPMIPPRTYGARDHPAIRTVIQT